MSLVFTRMPGESYCVIQVFAVVFKQCFSSANQLPLFLDFIHVQQERTVEITRRLTFVAEWTRSPKRADTAVAKHVIHFTLATSITRVVRTGIFFWRQGDQWLILLLHLCRETTRTTGMS